MARYAAVDIGSNSVRMMAADVAGDRAEILAQDRQVTRLGESVFRTGKISPEALTSLCATLARMAGVYKNLSTVAVRAVATSAVRDASNQKEFLDRTSDALGTPVEIISGPEEARLIYLGVESHWPGRHERTLIVDVGGGSAELILSENGQLLDAVSKPLGAVRLTELFVKSDPPKPVELKRMRAYIDEKLLPFRRAYDTQKPQRTIVTSATAAAILSAIHELPRARRDEADRLGASSKQVVALFERLAQSDVAARRKIPGIGPRRAEIVIAGAAVFLRVLELFELQNLYYCAAGVRDGIIADLAARGVGRELSRLSDQQRAVVETMAARYQVNLNHAQHVAALAERLFDTLASLHKVPPGAGKILEAAAYLHDIGHFVSNTGHHKHSAYLVANSDMPNFTDRERQTIAELCRFHRKSMPQARHASFQTLDPADRKAVMNLAPLLRIADSLDRGQDQRVMDAAGIVRDNGVVIEVKADAPADLEIWAATEAAKPFREVYGLPVSIQRVKSQSA